MDTLTNGLAIVAGRAPDATAMVDGDRRIAYADFWQQARQFAALLAQHGVQKRDRVAILLPNRIEAAIACYGTWLAGAVAVPLNVQAKQRDLVAWLGHCGASFVLYEDRNPEARAALAEQMVTLPSLVLGSAAWALPQIPEPAPARTNVAACELALILYTSGTTGTPKGVMLSHGNLVSNVGSVLDYLQLTASDSVMSLLPFYYAYGASVLHTHLLSGACVHLAPNLLFPHQVVETMVREGITGFSGVPSMFALLLDRVHLDQYDLGMLRYLTQAGGAMSSALTLRLRESLPRARLFVMYGQTEATSRLTRLPPDRLVDKLGSAGIPIRDVELKILRDDGSAADTGEDGNVLARGAGVMLGYWENPELTASVLRDGWLHTGDMGHLDADGFLYLCGRRSDMIKTGAHRVHPNDVEEVIAEMPGVIEVAVVGVEDELLGQVVKAFVVAHDTPARAAERIKAHCRKHLAQYKIPRIVEFTSALPRTASGKIKRIQLMEQHAEP